MNPGSTKMYERFPILKTLVEILSRILVESCLFLNQDPVGSYRILLRILQDPAQDPTGSCTGSYRILLGSYRMLQDPNQDPTGSYQDHTGSYQDLVQVPVGSQQDPKQDPTGSCTGSYRILLGSYRILLGSYQGPNRILYKFLYDPVGS